MRATIKQLAEQAGVSIGTVDRVLHKRGGVSKDTERLVLKLAEDMGYHTNSVAKALKFQKKPIRIGVILNPPEYNYFSGEIHQGVDAASREIADFGVKIKKYHLTDMSAGCLLDILDTVEADELDGLILKPVNHPEVSRRITGLCRGGMVVITCVSDLENCSRTCFIGHNQYKEGRITASLLTRMLGPGAGVAVITGTRQVLGHHRKTQGFDDYIREKRPDIRILGMFEVNREVSIAVNVVQSILKEHTIDGLFIQSMDRQGIEEIYHAFPADGKKPIICTFGTGKEIANLLMNDTVTFAIEENPFKQGYVALKTMFDILFNEKYPTEDVIDISAHLLLDEWL